MQHTNGKTNIEQENEIQQISWTKFWEIREIKDIASPFFYRVYRFCILILVSSAPIEETSTLKCLQQEST